jgi:hypothetical protein
VGPVVLCNLRRSAISEALKTVSSRYCPAASGLIDRLSSGIYKAVGARPCSGPTVLVLSFPFVVMGLPSASSGGIATSSTGPRMTSPPG